MIKKFLLSVALLLSATLAFGQSLTTNNASGSQSDATSMNAGNNQLIQFVSPGQTEATERVAYSGGYNSDVHYNGQYTVKTNASVGLGAFAPSMSGYNCAATAQAGGSQANAGLTAVLGFPVLLDPGKICVMLTLGNMHLQMAQALAPVDRDAAMMHVKAQQNLMCQVSEVYEETMKAQRDAGIDCPLSTSEKKAIDKEADHDFRNTAQGATPDSRPDAEALDAICGENAACQQHYVARKEWRYRVLAAQQKQAA